MHIESFNHKLFNKYSKVKVEEIVNSLEKVFDQDLLVNIIFVKENEIRKLNKEYRNMDNVTDVLSFPLDNTSEVYICPKYVERSFKGEKYTEEIIRLAIHGILHLLGYDHKGKFEEGNDEEMFEVQEEKLKEVLNLLNKKMYLIAGLGNPGKGYENMRHNAGYIAIDKLAEILDKEGYSSNGWKNEKIFDSEINVFEKDNIKIVLLKPTTFMNNSGIAVKKALKKYKLEDLSKELILIHDDLDISLGEYKIQSGTSPKCHYGVKSVEDHLGTADFVRVRIGIDSRKDRKIPGEKYVLMNFSEDEKESLFECIDTTLKELLLYLK